ncbi:hypothetical protein FISHEDRAFT_59276 [Fistulina hepatica ATCC 64428]|uniref:Uncharacterized protein n=1 Tax=Fistulina hepatica ATCC 64428 TaxID=1128425 RepID=A0A0D7AAV5_9AGAR|nr:hypothetical protein FISHEDRAFT_59276 [Fistulina hepatica ATCC 64428]
MSYILDAKIFNPNSSELPLFPQLCKFTVLADFCLDLKCGECDERSIANAILSRTDVEGTGVARLGECTYEVEDEPPSEPGPAPVSDKSIKHEGCCDRAKSFGRNVGCALTWLFHMACSYGFR